MVWLTESTLREMQRSLKKRWWAPQKGFHTSLLVVPVSSKASARPALRACTG